MEAARDVTDLPRTNGHGSARAVRALIGELELRHPPVRGHSRAVAALAGRIARVLGLDGADEATVLVAGSLHDVGKLSIPTAVLEKPGPLTESEWRLVRAHPADGEELLRPLFCDRPLVLSAVRSHHERWDGRGYPDGLAGAEAPLPARIIAVADAFQAMVEERPYRPALTRAGALGEIDENAGGQFDAACVRALRTALRA